MTTDRFPAGYRASRSAFLQLCASKGARMESFEHPLAGCDGQGVATDVALFGPDDARRVLIVNCATHGVEGMCGAGMQLGLLHRGIHERLGPRIRFVLVHALNPHGFLDLRRTNEDNVDLNRNFLDHGQRYPDDAAYAEIHPLMLPADWNGPAHAAADAQLADFVARRGKAALQAAISGGQYSFADGLFYGGRAPAWSNVLWRKLLHKFAADARYLAVVDLHSGLGERAACELISGAVHGSTEHRLAQQWFGEGLVFPGSTSTAPAAAGFMGTSLSDTLPHVDGALVVAEIGTVAFDQVLHALRADNWLHARGSRTTPLWDETKAAMDAAFVGRDRDWQEAVIEHGVTICQRVVAGLLDTPDRNVSVRGAMR